MELAPEKFKQFFPLPVTVITTRDGRGVANAAPYSCVMPILRPYPLIALASALPRHTLQNIRETGQFVVNVIGRPSFRDAMRTARPYPPDVDELERVGLETLPSKRVSPPRIAAAIGWVEATLEREVTDERYALVVGRILCSEINDRYLEDGRLKEFPLTLLAPHFRMLGDVLADREELESEFTL
ncbi:MAG: flavin reductase family protein [Thermodesulfobacteriota bacterium]|nr:flavin reductase family protein [Thermodesulfobacteriota bacterium]